MQRREDLHHRDAEGIPEVFQGKGAVLHTYPINAQGREARDRFEAERLEGVAADRFNWDYNLKPVIVVALLDFQFRHSEEWPREKFHSSYRLLEDVVHEQMTDAIRFVFLELGRFKKRISELETAFEKWIYLLKNMHRMTEIPAEFSEPLFERLFLLAEIGNFTPDEMRQYYNSLENMGDYDNIIHTAQEEAEKRGLEKGLAKGRVEGRTEAQEEMARKLKALGVDIDTIVEATGMDRDAVANM